MLATGNLRLIESGTLRSSVVSYYETVSLNDNRSAARASGYPGIVRGYLPFLNNQAPDSTLAGFAEHAMRMFESEQFVTTLHGHMFWVDFQLDLLEDLLSEVTAAKRGVDAELERLR